MAELNGKFLAINAVAGLVVLAGAAALVRQVLMPETRAACSTRYPAVIRLPLERSPGETLSMSEFQSRVGGHEWGVLQNSVIVRDGEAEDGVALKVQMRKGSWGEPREDDTSGGVGFRWAPSTTDGADSACLRYQVRLPEDFDYHYGGRLPGLFGPKEDGQEQAFAANFVWRSAGKAEVEGHVEAGNGTRTLSARAFEIPKGRWVTLEQEVVLNTPGQADGVLRVWIDGELKTERSDVAWRKSDKSHIQGVAAQVFYEGRTQVSAAPKDTTVKISSFAIFSN